MKVDASLPNYMSRMADAVRKLEADGYDGGRLAELNHDPFLPLAIAAEHSEKIQLVTSVAVAFARNPMSMALIAHDLNAYSGGRMVLGLGSQVRGHIERRFSMPWYKAAAQMREFITAMQAIFAAWYDGERLDFDGEFYEHTLMPRTFTPEDTEYGAPRIHLSATGPLMTKVAAEVADGMIMHPFSSEKFIREVTLPAIAAGRASRDEVATDFELDYAPIIATGETEEAMTKAIATARDRIAFYGSTQAYKPVLDCHGWGDLQIELHLLNKRQQSAEMAALISDEVLHTIAIVGTPEEVVTEMQKRFGGVINRTGFQIPGLDPEHHRELVGKLRNG